jgi:MFS family permease
MWMVVLAGWVGIAGGLLAPGLAFVIALQFLMGLFTALINMANNRLAMAIVPAQGRNHFFALYSVFANVAMGLAPIGWGLLIDAIGARHAAWLGLDWNRYTIFFALAAVAFAVTFVVARRLHEPKAASMEQLISDILANSPLRFWAK